MPNIEIQVVLMLRCGGFRALASFFDMKLDL